MSHANDEYESPGAFTRKLVLQPVHPHVVAEHKAELRAQAAQDRDKDRAFLEEADEETLMELCEMNDVSPQGSRRHLIARLMGDAEPTGPRFAT